MAPCCCTLMPQNWLEKARYSFSFVLLSFASFSSVTPSRSSCHKNEPMKPSPAPVNALHSLKLAQSVASELARLTTLEMECIVSGSARADSINTMLQPFIADLRTPVEYGCALGGILFRPFLDAEGRIQIDAVQGDCFCPTRFDSSGRMTGAIFYDHLVRGNRIYTRLEDHEFSGSTYSITVKAFRSMTSADLGIEVSLTDVPEWSAISPHTEFSGVDRPLWGYFRVSSGNSTDRHSPLGVSVYAAAVDTIHDADEQYGRLLWEYDGGQLALDVDQTALRPDINGESVMPQREQRLYRNWLNGSSGSNGRNLYEVFAPALRDESYRRGMDAMLKRVEFQCGLAYGTLSDPQNVDKTTAIAGTVFSLAFSALCVILATPLLQLMQVPADILPIAASYLRIVFAGLIFTFFYNFLAATMRALGDSKSALYFLMISSVLNIGGDLFFVQVLNWGSNGCALSTVVSEALCCVLCVLYIRWKVPILQLGRRWLVFDGKLLRKTVSYGWASAMQQATVQLGKIAVQAIVNTMGVNAMAAFTAASRIDDFAYTPQQNIGHAMTTLMAQNRGAGKHDRVKQGFHCGMRIEAAYGVLIAVVCFSGAPFIMKLFVTDPEVVHLGVRFLRTVSLFYLMPAATNGIQGFFRGIGDLKVTLVSSTFNMVFRLDAHNLSLMTAPRRDAAGGFQGVQPERRRRGRSGHSAAGHEQ